MRQHLPPLNALSTFRAVIETGSFAKAARQLNVTPSAISHQMRGLEAILGLQLFNRANRTIQPTDAAMQYHAALDEGFSRIAAATARLSDGVRARRFAIHASPSFATLWLMPRIKEFIRARPDLDVTLSSSNEPVRVGRDGFDIDIQHARPVPEDSEGVLIAEELIVPMASPEYLAEHPIVTASDIAGRPAIHSLRCLAQWTDWFGRYAPGAPSPSRGMRFDRSFLALAAAADGLGITLESTLLAQDFIRTGRLVMPLGALGLTVRAHRLIYARASRTDPEIAAFCDWVREKTAAGPSEHMQQSDRERIAITDK